MFAIFSDISSRAKKIGCILQDHLAAKPKNITKRVIFKNIRQIIRQI